MDQAQFKRLVRESAVRATDATLLADQGKCRCNFCHQIKDLKEAIVVVWGSNILFAGCPECFPTNPIAIRRVNSAQGECISVTALNTVKRPLGLITVHDLSQVNQFAAAQGLPKLERSDL